ncbi:MAG: hypothetical protein RML84_09115 [Anaerolineae bacterium]|nr:hypothetical protein [Anaerolineae bacterium]
MVKLEVLVPEDAYANFRAVARRMFPQDSPKDAAQLLLSMFIERIGDEKSWSLFLAGLPLEAREAWRDVARQMERKLRGISAELAQSIPSNFRELWQMVHEGQSLTEEDAVAALLAGAAYGQLRFDGEEAGALS